MSGIVGYSNKGSGIVGLGTPPMKLTDLCPFVNSWVIAASDWDVIIQRDNAGIVTCYGTVKGGSSGSATSICTLPVGWRPTMIHQHQDWAEPANGSGTWYIATTGVITHQTAGSPRTSSGHWMNLNFTFATLQN